MNVGNVTTWSVSLATGARYFFAAQAVNTAGLTSPFSAEVSADFHPAGSAKYCESFSDVGKRRYRCHHQRCKFWRDAGNKQHQVPRHCGHAEQLDRQPHRRARTRWSDQRVPSL